VRLRAPQLLRHGLRLRRWALRVPRSGPGVHVLQCPVPAAGPPLHGRGGVQQPPGLRKRAGLLLRNDLLRERWTHVLHGRPEDRLPRGGMPGREVCRSAATGLRECVHRRQRLRVWHAGHVHVRGRLGQELQRLLRSAAVRRRESVQDGRVRRHLVWVRRLQPVPVHIGLWFRVRLRPVLLQGVHDTVEREALSMCLLELCVQ